MSRAVAFLALCAAMGPAIVYAANGQRPNIVFFMVDDMGWMDSSAYGSSYYETPTIERLSSQGMQFTDAYALPLCSPTRASILTGQHSSRHGVTSASGHQPPRPENASPYPGSAPANRALIYAHSKNYLDPELVTLADVLRAAGYRTGHFGKWHLGMMPEHWPDKRGFETTWHCTPDPGPPSYFSPYGVEAEGLPGGRRKVGNITDGPDGEYITDRLTDEALAFIERHRERPFFLNLWHYSVHGPWGHKPEYTRRFATKTDPRGEQRNPIMASMLQSVDESLGRVMRKLDELDLAEKTLFIFYSDNGGNAHSNTPDSRQMTNIRPGHPRYPFVEDWKRWAGPEPPTSNAPLREGKGRIYEGGIRVPLIVRWPGRIEAGATSGAIVGPIDFYPTILEAAGLAMPGGHVVDGVSFLPVLEQTGEPDREAYFTWFPHLIPAVSVRRGDWKLIRRFEAHPQYPEMQELYNLREDVGETTNLASRFPDRVKELDSLIDRFIRETGALVPKPNPEYRPQRTPALRAAGEVPGLVPKMCTLESLDGAVRVVGSGRAPFLGTAQVRHDGAITMLLRARSKQGGPGKVQWRTADQERFPEDQSVGFQLAGGDDWQNLRVDMPVRGRTATVRVYLPANEAAVDIESLRFVASQSAEPVREWNFREEAP